MKSLLLLLCLVLNPSASNGPDPLQKKLVLPVLNTTVQNHLEFISKETKTVITADDKLSKIVLFVPQLAPESAEDLVNYIAKNVTKNGAVVVREGRRHIKIKSK